MKMEEPPQISEESFNKNLDNLKNDKEFFPKKLYHLSSWEGLLDLKVNDTFILTPGPQGAEGVGVYFSENEPRVVSSVDGIVRSGKLSAIIEIPIDSTKGWWRSKNSITRKFNRPKTWHSNGKKIKCLVKNIVIENEIPHFFCEWDWA
jgi:hypothetical protein